jgi:hypothetical protein
VMCMQGKIKVTARSLTEWFSRPAPPPYDPTLTIHAAATHNAHLAFCEGVLVRMLDRLESQGMTYPHELCGCVLHFHPALRATCSDVFLLRSP